jgi:hypothetical protein
LGSSGTHLTGEDFDLWARWIGVIQGSLEPVAAGDDAGEFSVRIAA